MLILIKYVLPRELLNVHNQDGGLKWMLEHGVWFLFASSYASENDIFGTSTAYRTNPENFVLVLELLKSHNNAAIFNASENGDASVGASENGRLGYRRTIYIDSN